MKSSKMENLFEINPATETSKNLSPLTYYQPFKSSFDPGFGKPSSLPSTAEPFTSGIPEKMWTGLDKSQILTGNINLKVGNKKESVTPVSNSNAQIQTPISFGNSFFNDIPLKSTSNNWFPRFVSSAKQYHAYLLWLDRRLRRVPEGQNSAQQCSSVPSSFRSDNVTNKYFAKNSQGNTYLRNCNASDLNVNSLLVPSRQANFESCGTLKAPSCNASVSMNSSRSLGQKCESGLNRVTICNFCKNNKEVPDIYLNHNLYDPETKKLTCPVLRKHVCGICGETGDRAHTLQYCPVNRQRGFQAKVPVLLKSRTITNSTGKIRRN